MMLFSGRGFRLFPHRNGVVTMIDSQSRDPRGRIFFDGAIVAAIVMQISAALYWAGIIRQEMTDVTTRVTVLERQQRDGGATMTSVAVRLGRIEQKLTDIGQKVGVP